MDRIISIKLFDQAYRFKAEAGVAEVEQVAHHVVDAVEKARASAEMPSKLDAVILAALNIANDYFEIKRDREEMVKEIELRSEALIKYIDNNV